jgi:hypothetical protein
MSRFVRHLWRVALLAFAVAWCSPQHARAQEWWTFGLPPLAVQSVTSVGDSGGSITITLVGGVVASPLPQVQICLSPCSTQDGRGWGVVTVTVTSATTTQIMATVPPTTCSTTCPYDLQVSNYGGAPVALTAVVLVYHETTPLSCISSVTVKGWARADTDTNTGCSTTVTGITDKSGLGNNPGVTTNLTHSCGADFGGQPYWVLNGTSSSLGWGTIAMGTNTVWLAEATRALAPWPGTDPPTAGISNNSAGAPTSLQSYTSSGNQYILEAAFATWGTSTLGTSIDLMSYVQGTGATAANLGVSVNGQPYVTNSESGGAQPSGTEYLTFGASSYTSASSFASMELADVVIANGIPTSAEKKCVAQYLNLRYQLAPAPAFTDATVIGDTSDSSQSAYVRGANFVSGITATISRAGVSLGTVTTTMLSSSLLAISLAAGTYTDGTADLVLQNPDAGTSTNVAAITITGTLDPMQIFGTESVIYHNADTANVTLSGGNVTAFADLTHRGNVTGANTALAQTASDSTFGNQGSVTCNGSSSIGKLSSALLGGAVGDSLAQWAVYEYASSSGATIIDYEPGGNNFRTTQTSSATQSTLQFNVFAGATTSTTGTEHLLWVRENGGTTYTIAVSDDNGTEGTNTSGSSTAMQTGGIPSICARTGGSSFWAGKIAAFGMVRDAVDANLTTTKRTNLCRWAHTKYGTSNANCP